MFTKADLKNGDLVVFGNKDKKLYIAGFFCVRTVGYAYAGSIIDYTDDLIFRNPKDNEDSSSDIVEIYRGEYAKKFMCIPSEMIYYRSRIEIPMPSLSSEDDSILDMLTEMGFTEG